MVVNHNASVQRLRILMSYRREDVNNRVRRLHAGLLDAFGREAVFMDAGGTRTRAGFSAALDEALMQCDVVLALIDKNWRRGVGSQDHTGPVLSGVLDAKSGDLVRGTKEVDRRFTHDRDELVQLELESALRQGVKVIAVLLDGADMPTRQDLPESMAELARADARQLSRRRWRSQLTELVEELRALESSGQRRVPLRGGAPRRRAPREVCRVVHDGPVTSVTFNSDGTRLATGSVDKTARVWDSTRGQELLRLDHQLLRVRYVSSVAFSPDSTRLATGTGDARLLLRHPLPAEPVRVWDLASGRELLCVRHRDLRTVGSSDTMPRSSVAFSADGARLLTGARTSAWIWDAVTGEKVRRIPHIRGLSQRRVFSVAFTPDGTRAVTAGDNAHVWDTLTGELVCVVPRRSGTLPSAGAVIRSITFSPDGGRLATTGFDWTVAVWDARTGDELFRVPFKVFPSSPVAFSPDGTRMAMASGETVEVWDAVMGRRLLHMHHQDGAGSVAFSPDGKRLASAGGPAARVWEL